MLLLLTCLFKLRLLAGNIKESIFIRVNNPTLNNNIAKFNLPHIWDRVLLNTGNPHIQTSTYSGIIIITSQSNLVSSTPSTIGPKQGAASLSCSNKKRTTSGRLSLNANILSGLWTRWRKDLTSLPVRSLMGLITKAPQVPRLSPVELKLRVTLSYPTHKVFVKVSK